jgi:hypothetical protein
MDTTAVPHWHDADTYLPPQRRETRAKGSPATLLEPPTVEGSLETAAPD